LADRASLLTELPEANGASLTDILYIVLNPTDASNSSYSISVATLANSMITQKSFTNGTTNSTQGLVYYDSNYLYITVANNTIKRVALSSF
jgi:hypothetical protein